MSQGIQTELYINLEGWDGEGDGREVQGVGGTYVHPGLIHIDV